MPIQDLIRSLASTSRDHAETISDGLVYRDFITVGLLVDRLKVTREPDGAAADQRQLDLHPGAGRAGRRLQIFNNWSPYMVADPAKVWLGLEYFCYEGDALWSMHRRGADRAWRGGNWSRSASSSGADVLRRRP